MKQWYFWNEQMPQVNPDHYGSAEALLEALKYKVYDRWSFIEDSAKYFGYFSSGQNIGYGCGLRIDPNNHLYISFVYKNSPMYNEGLRRGFRLTEINGTSVEQLISSNQLNLILNHPSATFTYIDPAGTTHTKNIAEAAFNTETVLHYDVINSYNKKVGYLVFNSFIESSKQELEQAFNYFQGQGINEFVLDLRYNGGGSVKTAIYLSSCIAGNGSSGQLFAKTVHNKQKSSHDYNSYFESTPYNLNLQRVFVITSGSSASASELVINSLKPIMNVYLIGSKTHGKPVGMYGWTHRGKVFVPIAFEMVNRNDEGKYFSGIPVSSERLDNVSKPFGDLNEDCLKEALHFIENGYFTAPPARIVSEERQPQLYGLRQVIGSY